MRILLNNKVHSAIGLQKVTNHVRKYVDRPTEKKEVLHIFENPIETWVHRFTALLSFIKNDRTITGWPALQCFCKWRPSRCQKVSPKWSWCQRIQCTWQDSITGWYEVFLACVFFSQRKCFTTLAFFKMYNLWYALRRC